MFKRMKPLAWSGVTAVLVLVAAPAFANDGRTYWECTKAGCIQIAAPTAQAVRALPAKITASVLPASVHPVAGAVKKAVPVDTLIDLSLVTGVFQ